VGSVDRLVAGEAFVGTVPKPDGFLVHLPAWASVEIVEMNAGY